MKAPMAATANNAVTGTAPRGAALPGVALVVALPLPLLVELTEFALMIAEPPMPVEFLHWSLDSSLAADEKVMSAH
jgi:hypothetical protein